MAKTNTNHPSDLLGFSRLAVEATAGLTALVEAMHRTIADSAGTFGMAEQGAASDIADLVYRIVREVTGLVGGGIDASLDQLVPMLGAKSCSPERQAVLAALNGLIGDYLAATDNPLAISMRLRRDGQPLTLERGALAGVIPRLTRKLVILAHGLCMNDLQWTRRGHDHGAALAGDLGYTPVHLHYNSGLHISTNGRAFSKLIEALVEQWPAPLEEFVIMAHSMGGLVSRSAHHYAQVAGYKWPRHLHKMLFLGTPHHGTPLERLNNWLNVALELSPYTAAFARLGKIRSAGITDLGYGNLVDDDWDGQDRLKHSGDRRRPVPLPEGVECYAIAATTEKTDGLRDGLVGDGIVPVNSALGRHEDPGMTLSFGESRQWIGYNMNHFDLLSEPAAYEQIRRWLAA